MHELKTINPYFNDVWFTLKEFEIRKDDRNFMEDDLLWMREYDPETKEYSGRSMLAKITYILPAGQFEGLSQGYCCIQISVIDRRTK